MNMNNEMKKCQVVYISDKKSVFFQKGKLYDAYIPKGDGGNRFFAFWMEDMDEEPGYYAVPAGRFRIIKHGRKV